MTRYLITPKAEADLIEGARWIRAANPAAARAFLDLAFETFDRLTKFPESGPLAKLRHRRLAGVRFCVVPPPFNRWLVFYRLPQAEAEILRVIHGSQNWRGNPASYFA